MKTYLLREHETFAFKPPLGLPGGILYVGPNLWIADGELVIRGRWEWDGNSFKLSLGPFIFGVADGPLMRNGEPAGKWPSAGHDIMYERIRDLARVCNCSVWKIRKAADVWFRDEWLRRLNDVENGRVRRCWRLRVLLEYYPAVRALGWILVMRRLATRERYIVL
ncbi:MAG: hypothetical protein N3A53_01620 [Verrucomicrobiae bacterium]|nr:hypothetical protein [Verrucomicrobiae bacterium]